MNTTLEHVRVNHSPHLLEREPKSDSVVFPPQMIFGQTQGRFPIEEVYETLEQVPGNVMEEPIWRE